MKLLVGAAALALALSLTACSSGVQSAQDKCGGAAAGITLADDGSLLYEEGADATGDAWTCLLDELVPDTADQVSITQSLGETGSHDGVFNGYLVVWGVHPEKGLLLGFDPQ